MQKRDIKFLLSAFLPALMICFSCIAPRALAQERPVVFSEGLAQQSIAWQIEELAKWLIKSRDLVPRPDKCSQYCFTIDMLTLGGSIEKNRLTFTLTGHVLADEPVLIPLFGNPKKTGLINVTVNNKPAITGFEDLDHWFVRSSERDFTIKGELEFMDEYSLMVIGPVNSFSAQLEDGKVIQGNKLSGLKNSLVHIESTKIKTAAEEPEIKPLFQLNRAFRISDDIAFEYRVFIRSSSQISNYEIPMKNSEIVLDVRGISDWRLEKDTLILNSDQKTIQCIITGSIKSLGEMQTDERSNYEWWLIESGPEHRVSINTSGKQVDSSESPIPRQMTLSRLYFLNRNNAIRISVQKLKSLEALAAVIHSQTRKIVWTEDGHLVAQDSITYENSGIDYLVFDTMGKPIYLAVDNSPQRLLSQEDIPDTAVLLPLFKGRHNAFIQNISRAKINHFGGSFTLPVPRHSFTISKGYLELGLPGMVIPLYFTEGRGFINPFSIGDMVIFIVIMILSFFMFESRSMKIFSLVSLAGLYMLLKGVFVFLLIIFLLAKLVLYLKKKYSPKTFLLIIIISALAIVSLFIYSLILPSLFSTVRYYDKGQMAPSPPMVQPQESFDEYEKDKRLGQKSDSSMDYESILREEKVISDSTIVEGIIPVALPMPSYDYSLYAYRELITKERPLAPRLLYITKYTLIPLYILWLISLLIIIRHIYPRARNFFAAKKPEAS